MIGTLPTRDYRRTDYRVPPRALGGLDAAVNGLIGNYRRRSSVLEALRRDAAAIDAQAAEFMEMEEGVLQYRLLQYRETFRRGSRHAESQLPPALAAIREAADRTLGMRPFLVQLMGALALHRGYLAEMATGEGKTLTAGLAAVLAGWTKRPCHVITVNDYLVERDADRIRPLFEFCAVKVGYVTGAMEPPARREGYACDVTYATSKEVLADFLRDRLRLGALQQPTRRLIRHLLAPQPEGQDGLVMRGLHTAIVDEADSVLIDEAVTPLIISQTHENPALKQAVQIAHRIVEDMVQGEHYRVNLRYREVEITEEGKRKLREAASSLPGLWRGAQRCRELAIQALVAREFFHRDKQYIVSDGKITIVDEFTGRPMPQRTWREGMHQAIETKEGMEPSDPSETIARMSFQRFFRCFHKVSGMTGTAREAAAEIWQVYNLPVIAIPTNRPCIREHWPDRVFAGEASKWQAIAAEIERLHATGRPILVGTRSVVASERLAAVLTERGLDCKVLNATRLKEEAQIISMAGERGRITIATNMAGRGTDIKLGTGVSALGGLHVIATERHESGRVDRQLFGRSARQGEPGSAQAFVSADDELIRRYLPSVAQRALHAAVSGNVPGRSRIARAAFALAQRNAQVLAGNQRKGVMRSDAWLGQALSFAGTDIT
jgi:preprotein translocase subunit SecA